MPLAAPRWPISCVLPGMVAQSPHVATPGGANFSTTVFPFILRSVNLLGIESVNCPMELRRQVWEHLASDYKPEHLLDLIGHEASLEELPQALATVLKGGVRGRTVIKVSKDLRDGDL